MNILNWNPDSVQVAYRSGEPATNSLAAYGVGPIALIGVSSYSYGMKWITPSRYIHLNREELYLGDLSGSSLLVDNAVTDFDFALIP